MFISHFSTLICFVDRLKKGFEPRAEISTSLKRDPSLLLKSALESNQLVHLILVAFFVSLSPAFLLCHSHSRASVFFL